MEESSETAPVLRNWALFIALAAGLAYYWNQSGKYKNAPRTRPQTSSTPSENVKLEKAQNSKSSRKVSANGSAKSVRKLKPSAESQGQIVSDTPNSESYASKTQRDESDGADRDIQDFARRMTQARNGVDVKKPETKSGRGRTIKQNHAEDSPARSFRSSQDDAKSDDTLPTRDAGGVADMLEPAVPAPSTLRITSTEKASRSTNQDKPRKDGKDVQQSKKARQNAKKKEEERRQREEDERHRKVLMESQRRTAREARGEPARNGIPMAKAPANNVWTAPASIVDAPVEPSGVSQANLLDTFDVESTSSSNVDAERHSTAATSTTDGAPAQWSEDGHGDMARALQESLNDGAWTTAGSKKKQKKTKPSTESLGDSTPTSSFKVTSAPTATIKPSGFHALRDEYEQRADVDPDDAANWDA